jgi:hypothetical protein
MSDERSRARARASKQRAEAFSVRELVELMERALFDLDEFKSERDSARLTLAILQSSPRRPDPGVIEAMHSIVGEANRRVVVATRIVEELEVVLG